VNIEEFLKMLFPRTYDKLEAVLELGSGRCTDIIRILGRSYFYKLTRKGVIDRKRCTISTRFVVECLEALILIAIVLKPRKRGELVRLYREFVRTLEVL
jgi:hypothetical protein